MKKVFIILSCSLSLVLYSCNESGILQESVPEKAGISSERLKRIDNMLQQSIDSGWIAGASAFIARDNKIIYNKAFGVSSISKGKKLATDDIFRIASQTKAITSVAAMMLFEEGKFLLDDPVSKYIPEFSHPQVLDKFNPEDSSFTSVPASREITIRDLFTHTSGIDYAGIGSAPMRAIYAKAGIPGGFGGDKLLIGDKMRALGRLPLVHNPGARFTYGLNVDVLGALIEIWSGESFDQYLRIHLFQPLGMNDTYFYLPAEKAGRLVEVNTENPQRKAISVPLPMADYPLTKGTYYSGGAGLSSTMKDYAVFLQMVLNKGVYNGIRFLSRRTVDLITCNQIGDLNLGKDKFGLGFEITTKEGQAQFGVTEGSISWGGYFGTQYWADPKEKLVCLIFMQQSPLSHREIQNKFKTLVYQALDD